MLSEMERANTLLSLLTNIVQEQLAVSKTRHLLDKVSIRGSVFVIGSLVERKTMLPDIPTLDHCFDLAEHFALRVSLLIFLLLALYRIVEREWRKR